MKLQFIKEDAVKEFINKMDEVTTESILCDESILELLTGSVPSGCTPQTND